MNACENCRFWNSRDRASGLCHRNPPQPCGRNEDLKWPTTLHGEWCGEWRAK